jgi:hypothetical protein
VGGPGGRRRAASFNAPFSRIALSRDDTKKPSSFSVRAGRGSGACPWHSRRLIRHARYFTLQLGEHYLTRTLFRQIVARIERLAWHPT